MSEIGILQQLAVEPRHLFGKRTSLIGGPLGQVVTIDPAERYALLRQPLREKTATTLILAAVAAPARRNGL
jgi:hypothetical protein